MHKVDSRAVLALLWILAAACRQAEPPAPGGGPTTTSSPASAASASPKSPAPPPDAALDQDPAPEPTPLPAILAPLMKPWKGDFDGMVKRRLIRVLTVQNPVLYAVDRGREVGMTYEAIRGFETEINRKLRKGAVKVHVVIVPVPRNELFSRLEKGEGDIAAAQLTITPERLKRVSFSKPFASGVTEVLVRRKDAPPIASIDDLSGQQVYVRRSSSYAEHIETLNRLFAQLGRPPLEIIPAPEVLEDGDILEMVNAGLVPGTVVDSFMADLYLQVFPDLVKHDNISSKPQQIAWAFRKKSPKLAAAINGFVKGYAQGSKLGNTLINKYLRTTQWITNARSQEDRDRFASMVGFFRKYGDQYDLDYLLMAAQGYQESGLDQSKRSRVGAIGVMQVMPKTARDKAVNIHDIENLESNIHAGIKYNRWVIDNYYKEPGISRLDRGLFAFASYNAGPGRVAGLRREAKAAGLNPNKWFNNVELIAAKRIGRETVTYVSNIYKYYLAYQLMAPVQQARQAARNAAAREAKPRKAGAKAGRSRD
jgi:membrane-bound lytic murein transglycosylase MltF